MSNLEKLTKNAKAKAQTTAKATTTQDELKTRLDFNSFVWKKANYNDIIEICYSADKDNGYKSTYLKDALSKIILLTWQNLNFDNRLIEIKYINQSSIITAQLISQLMYIGFIDSYEVTVVKDQTDYKKLDTFNISLFVKDNMSENYKTSLNEMYETHIPTLTTEAKEREEKEQDEKLNAKLEANSIRRANGLKEIEI